MKKIKALKVENENSYKERIIKLWTIIEKGLILKPRGVLFAFRCPKCNDELREKVSPLLHFNDKLSSDGRWLYGYYHVRHFSCDKCGYEYIKTIDCND